MTLRQAFDAQIEIATTPTQKIKTNLGQKIKPGDVSLHAIIADTIQNTTIEFRYAIISLSELDKYEKMYVLDEKLTNSNKHNTPILINKKIETQYFKLKK